MGYRAAKLLKKNGWATTKDEKTGKNLNFPPSTFTIYHSERIFFNIKIRKNVWWNVCAVDIVDKFWTMAFFFLFLRRLCGTMVVAHN